MSKIVESPVRELVGSLMEFYMLMSVEGLMVASDVG